MKTKTFFCLILLPLLLVTMVVPSLAGNGRTIAFSGEIVSPAPTSQTTTITPSATKPTTYTVSSTVTGRTLATFTSLAGAQQFVANLNPAVPYEK